MKLKALAIVLLLPCFVIGGDARRYHYQRLHQKCCSSLIKVSCPVICGAQTYGAVLDYDTFVDTNGTNLSAHTMNVGSGWTVGNGAFTIQSNAAASTFLGSSVAVTNCGQSGACTVTQVTWVPTAAETNSSYNAGIITRYTNGSNYVTVTLRGDGQFSIGDLIAGVFTNRQTVNIGALTGGTSYTITVAWIGNNVSAFVNGANTIGYVTSFNSTATNVGITALSNGTNLVSLDNFQCNNASVAENCQGINRSRMPCNFNAVLEVTASPVAGGQLAFLTVWFQSSSDDGNTWNDFACVSSWARGAWFVPVSTVAPGSTSVTAVSDGTLSVSASPYPGANAKQGSIGDMIRIRYAVSPGSSGA